MPHIMTVTEAAKYAKVSAQTIKRWIKDDTLFAVRVGPGKNSKYLIRQEDIDALWENNGHG